MTTNHELPGPRFLYLHGFASGPRSHKGLWLKERFAARGLSLELLDLRQPSLEHLRLSAMLAHVRAAISGPRERVVLIGSSLGGLTAARLAEDDPRVFALVLLAPAFRLAERWRARLGEEGFARWRETGWLPTHDFAEDRPARVDFGFIEEMARLDVGVPDVRVPTLIVHGRGDDTVSIDGSRAYAAGRRHVRLVEVDDGHELTRSLPTILDETLGSLSWVRTL